MLPFFVEVNPVAYHLQINNMGSKLITSPWWPMFENFISSAQNELLIMVPFYSNDTVKFILTGAGKGVSKRFLLALTEDGVRSGVQSTAAIKMLLKDKLCTVQFLEDLHAKVLIKDQEGAVVTSSNLTSAGLNSNLEMGIRVDDHQTVEDLIGQFEKWWLKSKAISLATLEEYDSLPNPAPWVKTGKRFGGVVKFPSHSSPIGEHASGWILIHSTKRFRDDSPQDELTRDYESGLLWRWRRAKPMKPGGPFTLLLAYEQKIFGEAETYITRIRKTKSFNFAFKLNKYKKLREEIPFAALCMGKRAHFHRDLIRLDDKIRAAYVNAKRGF